MDGFYKVRAYFTVEAAMVFPVVLGTLVFIIYMMFFQYNRCLMEQDMGVLVLRSAALQENDKTVLAGKLQEEAAKLQQEKYMAWDMGEISLSMEGNLVRIFREGRLALPFMEIWEARANYENEQINPTFLIRSCKKLMGGK